MRFDPYAQGHQGMQYADDFGGFGGRMGNIRPPGMGQMTGGPSQATMAPSMLTGGAAQQFPMQSMGGQGQMQPYPGMPTGGGFAPMLAGQYGQSMGGILPPHLQQRPWWAR